MFLYVLNLFFLLLIFDGVFKTSIKTVFFMFGLKVYLKTYTFLANKK